MSAVLASTPTTSQPERVSVLTGTIVPGADSILTKDCLAFVADLHERFDGRRRDLLQARRTQQAKFDGGALPVFRADTADIRESTWTVAPIPAALLDRRVEITGPTDPKMVINALNSGASGFMADFEDSTSPTFPTLITGQLALRDAANGTLSFTSADKSYQLNAAETLAVLHVRPRGLHLPEYNIRINDEVLSGSLFDAGVFLFHNAATMQAADRGPYLYLPKLQAMEEAQWWQDVLTHAEAELGLPEGSIKVTVLIETLPAAFQMHEILYVLRNRIAGLNCGRWDYIFSFIKTLRAYPNKRLPERHQVTMKQPFLRAYAELLIQTCHRRGALAMGGMAAHIPNRHEAQANETALDNVRADKVREVTAGHDGTWVAHPGLVSVAREVFDTYMPQANQLSNTRDDVQVTSCDLLRVPHGTISRRGFANAVEVCVRYLAAWLSGNGCVPIDGLMEDAATAEITRTQLWQWLHAGDLHLHDGTAIDDTLFQSCLLNLPSQLSGRNDIVGRDYIPQAITLLEQLTESDTLEEFLTLPAYELLQRH